MDLGEAQLPRSADVLDRGERRRARPAAMAGKMDVRGAGFGHTGGDRSHAARGDELDADPGRRIDRSEVGDQLGEILDRVDVVMGRWADVAHPRLPAPQSRDPGRRLFRGQLAALAGLRTLGDLDLELLASREVRRRDPEPGRRDLLDPGVVALAVRARDVPRWILAAFAGVGGSAGTLDPDRQGLVRLRRQGAD